MAEMKNSSHIRSYQLNSFGLGWTKADNYTIGLHNTAHLIALETNISQYLIHLLSNPSRSRRQNLLSNPSRSRRQNLGLTLFSFVTRTRTTRTRTRTLTKILALPG